MDTISIDSIDYGVDALSDEAKAQLISIQTVDRRLADLQEQVAILQTARIAYSNALRSLLPVQN